MVKTLAEALTITDEPVVITTGTAPYKIVHTNKAWAELTGYIFTEAVSALLRFESPSLLPQALEGATKTVLRSE